MSRNIEHEWRTENYNDVSPAVFSMKWSIVVVIIQNGVCFLKL